MLEKYLKNNEKPHWSQYMPLYGLIKIVEDYFNDRPTILNIEDPKFSKMLMVVGYHTLAAATLSSMIYLGLEEIFK